MQPRRPLALTAATVALATAALSSCGFDYATDRVNNIAAGVDDRSGDVDVLGAVVVSTEPGSGTFVASLANKTSEAIAFTELGSTTDAEVASEGFEPIEVPGSLLVNLAQPPAELELTGEFEAGNFVSVVLQFDNGQQTTMEVPVVPNAGDFADLDGPAPATPEPVEADTESDH